jgi:hypothetical protein
MSTSFVMAIARKTAKSKCLIESHLGTNSILKSPLEVQPTTSQGAAVFLMDFFFAFLRPKTQLSNIQENWPQTSGPRDSAPYLHQVFSAPAMLY